MKRTEADQPERRRFLKQVAAAGGGGALTLFASPRALAEQSDSVAGGTAHRRSRGYRLTGHIRAYYDSTRS